MTISTLHGRVLDRPGDTDVKFLGHEEASTASALNFFFGNYGTPYREYEIHVYQYEKPSAAGQSPSILFSTNGATFESPAGYDYVKFNYSATSAAVASGATGQQSANFSLGTLFTLATATGRNGSWLTIRVRGSFTTNAQPHYDMEWHFLNSASQPSFGRISGLFASGPMKGVQFQISAGTNFSAQADVYGIGRVPT